MIEINQSFTPLHCIAFKDYQPLMDKLFQAAKQGNTHVTYAMSNHGYIMLFDAVNPEVDDVLDRATCTYLQLGRYLQSGAVEELTKDHAAR